MLIKKDDSWYLYDDEEIFVRIMEKILEKKYIFLFFNFLPTSIQKIKLCKVLMDLHSFFEFQDNRGDIHK